MKALKLKVAGATAALAAVLGGGAALAATQLSPTQESDAIVADAAEQLGVGAAELDAALKQALKNRVDAALAAGRITEEQATEMKERIDAGETPLVGVGPGHGRGHHGLVDFAAAADFLGVTEAELQERLRDGDTLAEMATAEGKAAAGLVDALVAAAKADLDDKVAEGRLTEAQHTRILADLESRVERAVNSELPLERGAHGPRPDDGDDA